MNCRICDRDKFTEILDLGFQPWGNNFLTKEEVGNEPFYPLKLIFCENCHLVQLDYTVKKEVMFSDHTYLSGVTQTLSYHFEKVAFEVDSLFFKSRTDKRVLDIGSNDGTQLQAYKRLGYSVVGVESSTSIAEIANSKGVYTINQFFNEDLTAELGGSFDVINASGVFFHLEELHSVCRAIKRSLKSDGIFVVQFLYMKSIVDNLAFDQIYHEHLLYYTLETLQKLLGRHGLNLFDASLKSIHGGSIIGYVSHAGRRDKSPNLQRLLDEEQNAQVNTLKTYFEFASRVKKLKVENRAFLSQKKREGKLVYGLGAPVKGNTLLNYFDLGSEEIKFLTERNRLRDGLYSPGKHIPIILEEEVIDQPDVYYVLAWNFKKEILERNEHLVREGVEFYFPIDPERV